MILVNHRDLFQKHPDGFYERSRHYLGRFQGYLKEGIFIRNTDIYIHKNKKLCKNTFSVVKKSYMYCNFIRIHYFCLSLTDI